MLGLAIDTADRTASAALWRLDDGLDRDGESKRPEILAIDSLPPEMGKADQLILVVERLLSEQALDYPDLEVITVNRGPGSFTGIRSGVALTRGLALAAGLPVFGVTSHEALLADLEPSRGRSTMIALDARRGEVYVQAFAPDGQPLGEIEVKAPALAADDLKSGAWRLAGSGTALISESLSNDADVDVIATEPVDAGKVIRAVTARLSAGETPASGFTLQPLYVRAPDAVPPTPLIAGASVRQGTAV
ncbi:MAG: tRNA (adenosine(37)-N6)-threonylcarbamoyltransferase complex dimerization subunit type 1 TsaB [Pseudomonadota bacterium]